MRTDFFLSIMYNFKIVYIMKKLKLSIKFIVGGQIVDVKFNIILGLELSVYLSYLYYKYKFKIYLLGTLMRKLIGI